MRKHRAPESRRGARRVILEAANAARLDKDKTQVLGVRHIQEAVCICRRRLLVPAEVLEAAGFNAHA